MPHAVTRHASSRISLRIAQVVASLALVGSTLAACGGIAPAGSDGSSGSSSGSSGSSSGSSGSSGSSSGCVTSPAGGDCPPVVTRGTPKVHRAEAVACIPTKPPENPYIPDSGSIGTCTSNAQCTAGKNGRCDGNGHDGYHCTYDACDSDSECTGGGVCACNGGSRATNNVCIVGNCRVDNDCGARGYCSPTLGSCGHYGKAVGFYCHTAQDECVDDEDCAGAGTGGPNGYCAYEKTVGHWKCSTAECVG